MKDGMIWRGRLEHRKRVVEVIHEMDHGLDAWGLLVEKVDGGLRCLAEVTIACLGEDGRVKGQHDAMNRDRAPIGFDGEVGQLFTGEQIREAAEHWNRAFQTGRRGEA